MEIIFTCFFIFINENKRNIYIVEKQIKSIKNIKKTCLYYEKMI